ncbi:MFS transporter [Streptomyces aidingensis]|uniref:Drug resistance transporter, EmrB/QacA subfamily n=1 Tax=Streptomyces aidingensis TaxID=910347 RepID=A0A1I1FL20_9ACTN|nr:MFS transporter [Streptomyces aidingensis]SFC00199.1 drug resistance transporter, EmrB/QacA subfamily [Streptomyces aidingensis]
MTSDAVRAGSRRAEGEERFLATRRGVLTLILLCTVQFLDILDSSIVNVALPSIQRELDFSQQNLQWVLSGYVLTYGGFLLLGGRLADLLGRRRVLVAGVVTFALASLAGGLAQSPEVLVAARLVQGVGAALMAPAGLSILTTSFKEGRDRNTALGVWGAVSGLAAAAGVFFGGLLSETLDWRWVFWVNLPVCAVVLVAVFRLVGGERPERAAARLRNFDSLGAALATGGMLLAVYALVEAPDRGWGTARTIGGLTTAVLLLAAFVINERRTRNPLAPLSIFRIKGLAAADVTLLMGFAGFFSMFFFLTLYMQNVLGWSALTSGAAYLPVTAGIAIAAGVSSRLFTRTGTRPVIVAGSLTGAAGVLYLSRIPVDGSYPVDLLPGLLVMSVGLGAVFVAVTTAANAGVPADKAGLAAGLLNTSQQLGAALGLAIFSALATARTNDLFREGLAAPEALTGGYRRALLASGVFLVAAAVIALRAANARGEALPQDGAAPAGGNGGRVRSGAPSEYTPAGSGTPVGPTAG